jgi:hypothetical protein
MKKKINKSKYILLTYLIINSLRYTSQVTTYTLSSTNIIGQATVDSVLIARDTIVAKRDVRIVGNLKVKGEARFKDNLKVDGNTIFNGNLKISNFIGSPGLSKVFVDGNGFLQKGITFPASWECVPGSPNWNIGGNNFTSQGFPGMSG